MRALLDSSAVETELKRDSLVEFAARHLRHNFTVMTLDYANFSLLMSFVSVSTILPAFLERLGAPNMAIGAMPALQTVGYALPALLVANYAERLPRKLPFILWMGIPERLSTLLLAGVAFLLAARWPAAALVSALLAFAMLVFFGGAIMPAWTDMFAKVMPVSHRGRQLAASSAAGALFGVGGAALSGYFLRAYPFPHSYAYCFLAAFGAGCLSFLFLALTREPAAVGVKDNVPLRAYLRQLPAVLRRDHSFAWYLASKSIGVLGAMGYGFYTVFALRTLKAPEWQVGTFTLALLAGQTLASVGLGFVGDRYGHKRVLLAGSGCLLLANLVALAATHTTHIYVVFLLMSVSLAAGVVSDNNLALEFAPEAERPTYVALNMSLVAPLAFVSPLIGGLLADSVSYRAVFLVSALAGAISWAVLAAKVREPRHRSAFGV